MTPVPVPQTFMGLTAPMNQVEILLKEGKLSHENNPVARWCFGNTSVAKNGSGLIKYVKEYKGKGVDRTKRIDLTAAWVTAMARAMTYGGGKRSIYEERGLSST
jgi:phage terminase large subunit-like protein